MKVTSTPLKKPTLCHLSHWWCALLPYLNALLDPKVIPHRLPILGTGHIQQALVHPALHRVVKHLKELCSDEWLRTTQAWEEGRLKLRSQLTARQGLIPVIRGVTPRCKSGSDNGCSSYEQTSREQVDTSSSEMSLSVSGSLSVMTDLSNLSAKGSRMTPKWLHDLVFRWLFLIYM